MKKLIYLIIFILLLSFTSALNWDDPFWAQDVRCANCISDSEVENDITINSTKNIITSLNVTAENFLDKTDGLEWIKPEHIYDVDKADIETDLNTFVDIAGDTMTGDLNMSDNDITNINLISMDSNGSIDFENPTKLKIKGGAQLGYPEYLFFDNGDGITAEGVFGFYANTGTDGSGSWEPYINMGTNTIVLKSSQYVRVYTDLFQPENNNATDLGSSLRRWKDFYLIGDLNISDGSLIDGRDVSEDLVKVEGDTMTGNLTTSGWFGGLYDWKTTDEWSSFNGSVFDFNESMLSTTYYDAISMNIVAGTLDGGSLSNTTHSEGSYDGVTMNISEASGSPGLDVRINFTDGETFNLLLMRYKTSALSGDYPILQLWNYNTLEWDDYPIIGATTDFRIIDRTVFYPSSHISGGLVQLRFYKPSNGNTNNHYYIDWLAIATGYGTPAGYEIDPLAIHRDGTTPLTANWDAGSYNITADWGFMKINWSDIQNKFITAVDDIYIYISGTTVTLNETKLNATISSLDTNCSSDQSCSAIIYDTDETNLNVNHSMYSDNLEGIDWGTMTDTKYCVYDLANTEVDCNAEGGAAGIWTNVSGTAYYDGPVNTTGNISSRGNIYKNSTGTALWRTYINDTNGALIDEYIG